MNKRPEEYEGYKKYRTFDSRYNGLGEDEMIITEEELHDLCKEVGWEDTIEAVPDGLKDKDGLFAHPINEEEEHKQGLLANKSWRENTLANSQDIDWLETSELQAFRGSGYQFAQDWVLDVLGQKEYEARAEDVLKWWAEKETKQEA
jgi:hypothetical protein